MASDAMFIPCGTALLSARLRILVPCYLEAAPAPCNFLGLARTSSRDPQNDPNDLDRGGKNETATSIVLKASAAAARNGVGSATAGAPSCSSATWTIRV